MFSPTLLLSDCVSLFILHMTGLAFLLKSVELSLETVNCHWCRLGCYKSRPHKSPYVCCRLAYTTTLLLFIIASFSSSPATLGSLYTPLSFPSDASPLSDTRCCVYSVISFTPSALSLQWRFGAVSRLSHVDHKLKPSIVNKKKTARRKKQQAKEEEKLPRRWQRWRRFDTGKPELTHQQTITSPELMRALEEGWLAVKLAKNQNTMTRNDFHARMAMKNLRSYLFGVSSNFGSNSRRVLPLLG